MDMRNAVVMGVVADSVVNMRGVVKKTFATTSVRKRASQYERFGEGEKYVDIY